MKNNSLVGLLALLACSSVFRSTWAADEQVEDDEDDEDEPERRPGFGTKHRVLEFAEDNLEEIFDTHVHLVLFINGEEDGFDAVMDEFEALSMEYEPEKLTFVWIDTTLEAEFGLLLERMELKDDHYPTVKVIVQGTDEIQDDSVILYDCHERTTKKDQMQAFANLYFDHKLEPRVLEPMPDDDFVHEEL